MKILITLFVFCFMTLSLYSQGGGNRDTVYVDIYKMPNSLTPSDLVNEIKVFLTNQNYDIVDDSPIETDKRQDVFEKNTASWWARTLFGRKNLKEYPILIKHTLTFDQKKKGKYYIYIHSIAEIESTSLSDDTILDIKDDGMKSAKKIAKDEFTRLKEIVKNRGENK